MRGRSFAAAFSAVIALVMTVQPGMVAAAERDPDAKHEFARRKLIVEPIGVGPHELMKPGSARARNWKQWDAYQGTRPISESSFFRITGNNAQAERVETYRDMNVAMMVGGVIAMAAGAFVLYKASQDAAGTTGAYPSRPTIGGGVILTGAGLGMIVSGYLRSEKKWAPFMTVSGIADQYNSALRAELGVDF